MLRANRITRCTCLRIIFVPLPLLAVSGDEIVDALTRAGSGSLRVTFTLDQSPLTRTGGVESGKATRTGPVMTKGVKEP
jgi:hypothetical protein